MRKSIIAGLTLCAALALAVHQVRAEEAQPGEAQAKEAQAKDAGAKHASDKHARAGHRHETHRAAALAEQPSPFRIPAQPVVRDCVHVMFPQCARGYEGLNDGTFGR
jgi:hypothetical protein